MLRLATNLLLICVLCLFLFSACAGLGLGARAVTSNGNQTEINVLSHNFNNNDLFSNNPKTTTNRIDNDNTAGTIGLVVVACAGAWILGRMLKVG